LLIIAKASMYFIIVMVCGEFWSLNVRSLINLGFAIQILDFVILHILVRNYR